MSHNDFADRSNFAFVSFFKHILFTRQGYEEVWREWVPNLNPWTHPCVPKITCCEDIIASMQKDVHHRTAKDSAVSMKDVRRHMRSRRNLESGLVVDLL